MTYNGWTNRETWLVNLWHGDDLYDNCKDWTQSEIADYVKSYYDMDERGLDNSGLLQDFLSGCWSSVDWQQIAEHVKEE